MTQFLLANFGVMITFLERSFSYSVLSSNFVNIAAGYCIVWQKANFIYFVYSLLLLVNNHGGR